MLLCRSGLSGSKLPAGDVRLPWRTRRATPMGIARRPPACHRWACSAAGFPDGNCPTHDGTCNRMRTPSRYWSTGNVSAAAALAMTATYRRQSHAEEENEATADVEQPVTAIRTEHSNPDRPRLPGWWPAGAADQGGHRPTKRQPEDRRILRAAGRFMRIPVLCSLLIGGLALPTCCSRSPPGALLSHRRHQLRLLHPRAVSCDRERHRRFSATEIISTAPGQTRRAQGAKRRSQSPNARKKKTRAPAQKPAPPPAAAQPAPAVVSRRRRRSPCSRLRLPWSSRRLRRATAGQLSRRRARSFSPANTKPASTP